MRSWRLPPTYAFNDDDLKTAEANILGGRDLLDGILVYDEGLVAYTTFAYVVGFESEYGYVGIRPSNGGLVRMY